MKNSIITITTLFIFVLAAAGAFAQAPNTMAYQGRLADDAGNAITGTVDDVVFTIYDDTTGGATALWTETDTLYCDDNGVFTIELGLEVPIDAAIFNGEKRWLGIKVGGDNEMTPRQLLSSVPYALNSASAIGIAVRNHRTPGPFISFDSTTAQVLDSIEINAPGPGYILATAQMNVDMVHTNGSTTYIRGSLTDVPVVVASGEYGYFYLWLTSGMPSGENLQNVSVFRVFQVDAAGPQKYYFNAMSNKATSYYFNLHINALFIPLAYGPVDMVTNKSHSVPTGDLSRPNE